MSDNMMKVKLFHGGSKEEEATPEVTVNIIAPKTLMAVSFQMAFTIKSSHATGHLYF